MSPGFYNYPILATVSTDSTSPDLVTVTVRQQLGRARWQDSGGILVAPRRVVWSNRRQAGLKTSEPLQNLARDLQHIYKLTTNGLNFGIHQLHNNNAYIIMLFAK